MGFGLGGLERTRTGSGARAAGVGLVAANQRKKDAVQQLAPLSDALDDIEARINDLVARANDLELS